MRTATTTCSERIGVRLHIVPDVMRAMLALLLGSGAIHLVLGDLKEALVLLAFATMPGLGQVHHCASFRKTPTIHRCHFWLRSSNG